MYVVLFYLKSIHKMIRRFKYLLGKIYLAMVFWITLTVLSVQINQIGKRNNGPFSDKRSVDAHYNKNTDNKTPTINVSILTNAVSTKTVHKMSVPSWHEMLDFIPESSVLEKSGKVPYLSKNILKQYLQLPNITYRDKIAILTPVRNAERALDKYRTMIGKLTYPHDLISVYFGEDGSSDKTIEMATKTALHLKVNNNFTEAIAVKLNISGGIHGPVDVRHSKHVQLLRRAHLAEARNRLLQFVLRENKFDHILWIDSDVAELPADLVQQMLFAKSDVVATCCLMKSMGYKMKFDRNSWRETDASIQEQSKLEPDYLLLEGYGKSLRKSLPDLKNEGRVVPLDGVGGCALMVKAECHRSGLQFPEVVYKHHIETEGLAKMAHDMGYTVVGLPFVEVFHS